MRGQVMSSLYAMRRANGDWFALDDHGSFRVPVFRSSGGGMMARVRHREMRLFKPVALDGQALGDLVPLNGAGEVYFWLVDEPFTDVKRGQPMAPAQLALLVQEAARHARG